MTRGDAVAPVQVAWAWVDHLRAGGVTPWRDFREGGVGVGRPGDDATVRGRLPGAGQLELARRLAVAAQRRPEVGLPALSALLERTMDRSGPGRGLPVLPLDLGPAGPGGRAGRVGAPPTDPADVPVGELVRLGTGLLVDELLRSGPDPDEPVAEPVADSRARLPARLLSRAVPVAGAAVAAASLRAERPGQARWSRTGPGVLLLAGPLDDLLGQAWSARVQRGAPVPWPRFVRRWARRDVLPPTADLAAQAAAWAERVGASNVHVLAGPDHRAQAGRLLGRPPAGPESPLPLPPAAVDLLRRVNDVLAVRLPEHRQAAVRRTAVGLLAGGGSPRRPPGLVVPDAHRDWVDDQAGRLVEDLRRGGYPVHGDLDRVAVRAAGPDGPRRGEVLHLLLDALLDVAERER